MNKEIKLYQSLNDIAVTGGSVIFGGAKDRIIPLGELKDTFELPGTFYNRSLSGLRISNAVMLYDQCVAPLEPDEVYLHIGNTDLDLLSENAAEFDLQYSQLLQHIRKTKKTCRITIVSFENPDCDPLIHQLNQHLKVISQNGGCEFCDVATQRDWNPQQTKEVVSFLYSMGFIKPLKQSRPVHDIAKILFCLQPM